MSAAIALSISAAAREFRCSRETIRKVINAGGLRPIAHGAGASQLTISGDHDEVGGEGTLYQLSELIRAWYTSPDGGFDPDKLDPIRRKAFYDGELRKTELQKERRELIPYDEVFEWAAEQTKLVVLLLETIPDVLERDCGLKADAIHRVELSIDTLREQLATKLGAWARAGRSNG